MNEGGSTLIDLQAWADRQIEALIDAGVNPVDAEEIVQWVLDNLPYGMDPQHWIPNDMFVDTVLYGMLDDVVQDAKADWYSSDYVPSRMRNILDAKAINDESEEKNYTKEAALIYLWLRNRRQYKRARYPNLIQQRRLQMFLNDHVASSTRAASDVVDGVFDGEIGLASWMKYMRKSLQRTGLQYAALGGGGWQQLRISDFLAVDRKLASDYNYLREFAKSIRDGTASRLQAAARIGQYFGNARDNFFETLKAQPTIPDAEMTTIEIRHLGDANHCSDCIIYWAMGYQLADVLPSPHQQCACNRNCRCSMTSIDVPTADLSMYIGRRRGGTSTNKMPSNQQVFDSMIKQRRLDNDKLRLENKQIPDWLSNRLADKSNP